MDVYLLGRVFGVVAFVLAWLHPALLGFGWGLGGYVWWGRIGLILLTVAVVAAVLRVRHWRWIHRLNYVVFALIYVHSWNLGTDARSFPMIILYWLAPVVVIASLTTKIINSRIASNGNR